MLSYVFFLMFLILRVLEDLEFIPLILVNLFVFLKTLNHIDIDFYRILNGFQNSKSLKT